MNLTNADFGKEKLRLNNGTNVKLTGTTSSSEFEAGSYGFESQIEGSILSTRETQCSKHCIINSGKSTSVYLALVKLRQAQHTTL